MAPGNRYEGIYRLDKDSRVNAFPTAVYATDVFICPTISWDKETFTLTVTVWSSEAESQDFSFQQKESGLFYLPGPVGCSPYRPPVMQITTKYTRLTPALRSARAQASHEVSGGIYIIHQEHRFYPLGNRSGPERPGQIFQNYPPQKAPSAALFFYPG